MTIGIGRNLDDNPLTREELAHLGYVEVPRIEDLRVTEEQAWWLLEQDLARRVPALARALPFFDELDEVRQAVLVDMAYCLGIDGLLLFRQTLRSIAEGNYGAAAGGILGSRFASQVGRQPGRRAWRLALMMRTGEWPQDL